MICDQTPVVDVSRFVIFNIVNISTANIPENTIEAQRCAHLAIRVKCSHLEVFTFQRYFFLYALETMVLRTFVHNVRCSPLRGVYISLVLYFRKMIIN